MKVPRDRNGEFEPKLVPKHQRRLNGFNDIVISLVAKGMSTRDVCAHIAEAYQVEISPELVSKITDAILPELITPRSGRDMCDCEGLESVNLLRLLQPSSRVATPAGGPAAQFGGSLLRSRLSKGSALSIVEVSPMRLAGRRRGRSKLLLEFDRSENLSIHFRKIYQPFTYRTEVTFVGGWWQYAGGVHLCTSADEGLPQVSVDSGWSVLPHGA